MSFQLIDEELVQATLERARSSERRRTNHNFHEGSSAKVHRFLNAMLRGTYVQPHRHRAPPKAESFVVLSGCIAVFLFDDEGGVTSRHDLGEAPLPRGIDLAPGVWHCIAALTQEAVVFEVKPGPWDPATDKEFAPWAPSEGSPDSVTYLEELLRMASDFDASADRR